MLHVLPVSTMSVAVTLIQDTLVSPTLFDNCFLVSLLPPLPHKSITQAALRLIFLTWESGHLLSGGKSSSGSPSLLLTTALHDLTPSSFPDIISHHSALLTLTFQSFKTSAFDQLLSPSGKLTPPIFVWFPSLLCLLNWNASSTTTTKIFLTTLA